MTFVDKLISDTKQGLLDNVWVYQDFEKYKFVLKMHPLNGLNLVRDLGQIILPNGFALNINESKKNELINVIRQSIMNSAQEVMNNYINEDLSNTEDNQDEGINRANPDEDISDKSKEDIEKGLDKYLDK